MKRVPCQVLERRSMLPALPQSSLTQRYQGADRQHECIALQLCRRLVDEGTDPRVIFIMNKVSMAAIRARFRVEGGVPYIRSCWTLWSPDGSDLNSTLSARSTDHVSAVGHAQPRPRRFHGDLHAAIERFHAMVYLSLS